MMDNDIFIRDVRRANPLQEVIPALTSLPVLERAGQRELVTRCPFHEDQHPSLRVNTEKQLWHCDPCDVGGDVFEFVKRYQRVQFAEALAHLAERAGLHQDKVRRRSNDPVAVYEYYDEHGVLLYEVVRFEPKTFRQRRPVGNGDYVWNLADVRRVPYRLRELLAAHKDRTVFIVEGEKDADRLWAEGIVATTNAQGAGKWREEFSQFFAARNVVVLPDNDEPGRQHAVHVATSLRPVVASLKLVTVPRLPPKGDISDYFNAGGKLADLADIVDAAPEWQSVTDEPATASTTTGDSDDLDALLSGRPAAWATKLGDAAYHGVLGEIVRAIEPHTEADPAALLVQMLVAFGNVVGHGPHFMVEQTRHSLNLYSVIVGASSKARKGTSWQHVRALFEQVDAEWTERSVQSNLSSGEGLVYAVRDAQMKEHAGATPDVIDDGVLDKRLLVYETEFAAALRVLARDGNTLSTTLRQAWDGGNLKVLTKNNPLAATGAHISISGHITVEELTRRIHATELFNGFANRFLWVYAKRARKLPFGGNVDGRAMVQFAGQVREAVEHARRLHGPLDMDEPASELWAEAYDHLSDEDSGIVGAVTSRAEAQVRRLAAVYALLDVSGTVTSKHLEAALAVWKYAEASARFIFGRADAPRYARQIAEALRERRELTRSHIRELVGTNVTGTAIDDALRWLKTRELAEEHTLPTAGRPARVWRWVR